MVENEVKFILHNGVFNFSDGWTGSSIEQYYLPNDVRIRCESVDGILEHTINTKSLRDDGAHNELEYDISEQVYTLLHTQQSQAHVSKIRYSKTIDDELWSVDFLFDNDNVYCVLAECEMPEHRIAPLHIPNTVLTNLLYAVPRDLTSRYSNYKLSNKDYAAAMIERHTHGS